MNTLIPVATDNAIEIRGLRKHYAAFDLGPLDLDIPRGSIFGFVGPNGAGKSTTIDLMFGMGQADGGTIRMLGLDAIGDEVAVKQRAAYVGPELEYGNWGKIRHAIRFVRGFYPDTWDDSHCAELLERFQLKPDEKIGTLSFGSKTKLALVLALPRRPELLVLDEPTTGLDAIAKRQLYSLLLEIVKDTRRTVLVSSHNLADLERFADHVAILNKGKLLHTGPMDRVIEKFRVADLTLPGGGNPAEIPGVTVIQRQGDRVRILIDLDAGGMEQLRALGSGDLMPMTVDLEELFISLLKK